MLVRRKMNLSFLQKLFGRRKRKRDAETTAGLSDFDEPDDLAWLGRPRVLSDFARCKPRQPFQLSCNLSLKADFRRSGWWPPDDIHDRASWDRYWYDQVLQDTVANLFDMFCVPILVRAMRAQCMTTVLCAGNGISQEPRVLAEAGF
jgi:hypothetical protein